jgi:hypothetical protein
MAKPCHCGKPKPGQPKGGTSKGSGTTLTGKTMSFTLNPASGPSRSYTGSYLEAQAALVRLGGGTLDC